MPLKEKFNVTHSFPRNKRFGIAEAPVLLRRQEGASGRPGAAAFLGISVGKAEQGKQTTIGWFE